MKLAFARPRSVMLYALIALLLPLLAACGNPFAPAESPPAGTLPTAAVGSSRATSAPVTRPTPPAGAAPTAAQGQPPATAPAGETEPGTPLRLPYLEVGVVPHLYYTDRERALTLARIAGFDWVRQQVVWKDIEGPTPGSYAWGELDNIINDVAAQDLKLMVSIVRSPNFNAPGYNPTGGLPDDPKAFGNFVEAMAQRYGDKIAAYEIWNEMNLAVENGGRVTPEDAGKYVELLVEAYNRIKAVNPKAFVLAGPPSSTGYNDPAVAVADETYYRAMYRYKDGIIKSHFDAQAVHPGGSNNPPDTLWPDKPGPGTGCPQGQCWQTDPTFYFRHVENVRRFMVEEGVGNYQIWITEFGWATKNNTPGYEFGNDISFKQQADYIIDAIKQVNQVYRDDQGRPWVGVMFLWNLNFAVLWGGEGNPEHEQASFGILNPDWSPRPAFLALQGYLPQLKQEQGR